MSFEKHFDTNAFPFKTPLILMTAEGDILGNIIGMPRFIEFHRAEGGMLFIRSSQDADKYLTANKRGSCFFGNRKYALKFEAKMLYHNEAIIFEEYPTSKALGIITDGRNKYYHLPPVSELQHLAAVSDTDAAARRQLIMHFCESGKSSEEIANILMLLYDSTSPLVNLDLTEGHATLAERRQQILKLVELGTSTKEVGEVLKLLYGTAAQIMVEAEHEDEGSANLKKEEGEVESEDQYVCVGQDRVGPHEKGEAPQVLVSSFSL